jgi:hypothetical protein
MKLYFDNCCYGRPGDDHADLNTFMEAAAILDIIGMAGTKYTIFGSRALDKELAANPKEKQRAESQALYNKAVSARAEYVRSVFKQYIPLAQSVGIRNEDALHLCYAISAGADYLLTTDGKFLKRAARLALPIRVINPLDFGGAT